MKKRILLALLLVGIVGGIPFLFRPEESAGFLPGAGEKADKLIIISPHSEPMKYEFERGFRKYYKAKFGRDVYIDYRAPGGTSDIVRYIADRFTAEFRLYWEKDEKNPPWSNEIAGAFAAYGAENNPHLPEEARLARKKFLASDVGIGIDIFFGGGTFEHARNAKRGYSVDGGVAKRHPEYLHKDLVPLSFGGDNIYDPKGLYYGVSLSSFGICYNKKRLKEMENGTPPERWRDLASPRFFQKIAAADPTKSGSANKSYELIIQQAMHDSIPKGCRKPTGAQLDGAWSAGLNLVRCLMANARVITDSAGSVTHMVSTGNAVAGTAIDFYGLAQREWNSWQLGEGKEPEITYVPPKGGTTVSADPIQLLRGAPNRKVAEAFLDYVIGPEGQKLLCYKRGIEGGPEKYILRHAPVRRDLYGKEYHKFLTDPDYAPYEAAKLSFTYRGDWTGRYFSLIRILIKCIMLDVRDELVDAWKEIIAAGGPEKVPMAMKEFTSLPFSFREASRAARLLRTGKERTALDVAATCRQWSDFARARYRKAKELAKQGK